ncbi:hypothetical protein D3C72_668960 [compost metagenome]
MSEPTISRCESSSVAMSISMSYCLGAFSRRARAWVKYRMAAASSPFAPPNCS